MSIVRRCLVVLALAATSLVGLACPPPQPTTTTVRTTLDGQPAWSFSFDAQGVFHVDVARCQVRFVVSRSTGSIRRGTQPCPLSSLLLTVPWGVTLAPSAIENDHVGFTIDWSLSPTDPLDARTHPTATGAWRIEAPWLERPVVWNPGPADVSRIIAVAGAAKGIETEVLTGGAPPELVVEDFHVVGGALVGGVPTELVLTVGNHGTGDAYRVYATTRSSVAEIHGLQLSFGTVAAGASETRRVVATVPASLRDRDATVVLEFAEANHYEPRNLGKRFAVRAQAGSPRLTMSCALRGGAEVVAGDVVHVICAVGNEGVAASTEAVIDATGGAVPSRVAVPPVHSGVTVDVDIPLQIPHDARIDQHIPVAVTVTEPRGGSRVQVVVEVVVRVPKVCPQGRLSRDAYRAKRAELEKARDAGELTAAEFDAYDIELVGCLQ